MSRTEDKGGYVGRGGLKLEAALAKLGGAKVIAGARALDIGASTGGFTECLLRHGAREVTAIEVGHGQLHEKLRVDPRVVNLERINFKTVSLKVAPGPFDFFVIDVSFVAARTMLRPLAFRLRPGAEGVILVKPQFELPDRFVHEGKVASQRLRDWALHRVLAKGKELGFRMVGSADSPVELESGTVEVLTRWRFDGPGEKLADKPLEKREKTERAAKPHARVDKSRKVSEKPEREAKLPFEVPELPKKPRRRR